ncbi:hypothetical protein T484DRAFT_1885031 [Baffinella frigidus]|nr:hypothetical protein T484DRAFT_1885031 [Cryptophyta sp. CCMP2293]
MRSMCGALTLIISVGAARTGTGRFDDISDDILFPIILARLCTEKRSKVGAELDFASLHPGPAPRALPLFLGWLRDPAGVTKFSLETGDSLAPDAVKKAISALPSLTTLSLSGKKITGAVLTHVAKLPAASNLTTLCLDTSGSFSETSQQAPQALKLLKAASRLTTLALPPHLASEQFLRQLSATHRRGRNGGAPLLTRLALTYSFSTCKYDTLACIGQLFPELEVLDVHNLSDGHFGGGAHSSITAALARGSTFTVAPFPRLRLLSIHRMGGYEANMGSAECEAVLSAIFAACPVLESLSVTHGQMSTGSKKRPVALQPLPTATRCWDDVPASLTDLSIHQISLGPDAFAAYAP